MKDNGIGWQADNQAEIKLGVGLQSTRERLERMCPIAIHFPSENQQKVERRLVSKSRSVTQILKNGSHA